MTERIKFMKGKEVREDEMSPVVAIAKIGIIPLIISILFAIVDDYGFAPALAFILFAALGFFDWKDGRNN